MATTTDRYLSYPAAAAGVTANFNNPRTTIGVFGNFGSYTQVVPASTITSDCEVYGVTTGPNTQATGILGYYEVILEFATGTAGNEVHFATVHILNITTMSAAQHFSSNNFIFPEPIVLPANTRLSVRGCSNMQNASSSGSIAAIKIMYKMP